MSMIADKLYRPLNKGKKIIKQIMKPNQKSNNSIVLILVLMLTCCSNTCKTTESKHITFDITPDKIYQGDLARITILPADYLQSVSYRWANYIIKSCHETNTNSFIGFVPVDLEEHPGDKILKIIVQYTDGSETTETLNFTVMRKKFPLQKLTLPKSMVVLSKQDEARDEHEQEQIRNIYNNTVHEKLWDTTFIKPVKGPIGTPFGVRRLINNIPKQSHSGVDIKAPKGAPVGSTSNGLVVYTGNHFFSGKSVCIDHGMGIISMYFHLSKISVKKGQMVKRGQTIGLIGSTGRATGPHLHWGIRVSGQRISPMSLLRLMKI